MLNKDITVFYFTYEPQKYKVKYIDKNGIKEHINQIFY